MYSSLSMGKVNKLKILSSIPKQKSLLQNTGMFTECSLRVLKKSLQSLRIKHFLLTTRTFKMYYKILQRMTTLYKTPYKAGHHQSG